MKTRDQRTVLTTNRCAPSVRLGACLWYAAIACTAPANSNTNTTADESEPTQTTTPTRDAAPLPQDAGISFDQCAAVAVEANVVPANILFILDSSGSMNCVPPNGDEAEANLCKSDPRKRGDGPSKWQVTYASLAAALEPLVGRNDLNVAVSSFPLAATRCDAEVEPVLDFGRLDERQLGDITAILEGVTPDGETPIAGAAILGYAAVAEDLRNGNIRGNAYVVLLTDGEETCKPEELTKLIERDAPMALEGFGIRTFVIGAPGSEDARLLLSQLAHAGGTDAYTDCNHTNEGEAGDCHFDMTQSLDFQGDLAHALEEITRTKALSCEFDVPRNPDGQGVDLGKVNVTFVEPSDAGATRKPIGRHEGPTGNCDDKEDGWTYSSDRKHILLCGEDCKTVKAATDAQVQIVLGCPTVDRGDIR